MSLQLQYSIDTVKLNFSDNSNIIEVCFESTALMPRFCFHEQLSCAGNCRMCLIEVDKNFKPLTSCSAPVTHLVVLFTQTPFVFKAREGVIELTLSFHPLDCPVCDQGGECDLQDEVLYFASDRGRFFFIKRSVHDENWGVFIKSVMVRCIHCTRCVRFLREVAGVFTVGVLSRGSDSVISLFKKGEVQVQQKIIADTEFFGNVVDLCPVGALTTKTFAFVARPWELRSIITPDIFETIGNLIRVDFKGYEIARVMSFKNETNMFDWVSDRVRFGYDSFRFQRVLYPLTQSQYGLIPCKWSTLLMKMTDSIQNTNPREIQFIYDIETLNFERLIELNAIAQMYGLHLLSNDLIVETLLQQQYHECSGFNLEVLGKTELLFFCGLNLRYEMPLFTLVIRDLFKHSEKNFSLLLNNSILPAKLPFSLIGITLAEFHQLNVGKLSAIRLYIKSKKWILVFGLSLIGRLDFKNFMLLLLNLRSTLIFFGIDFMFHEMLMKSEIRTLSMFGFSSSSKKFFFPAKVLWLYNVTKYKSTTAQTFMFSTHMYDTLQHANFIIPIDTVLESNMTIYNFFGNLQKTSLEVYTNTSILLIWRMFINNIVYKNYNIYKFISLFINSFFLFNNTNKVTLRLRYFSFLNFAAPIKSFLGDFYQSRAVFVFSGILNACSIQMRKNGNTMYYFC
jgi:hypothetical protein